jgi:ABC-type polysaccharide/polyol phosphate transport system ATPase subunit
VIDIKNVSMNFRLANDRILSLKEYVIKRVSNKITYKHFRALSDVSFSIQKGEVIGIIGNNGAGKSTLLKIISGILTPTKGNVKVSGNIAPMLELGAGFDMDLTARENIFLNGAILGYSKQYLTEKFSEIVDFSELSDFLDVPIRNFSSGMIMRLAFSIATLVDPDILIVDEILSVGDAKFQKKSAKRMFELMSGGTTVIMVSHSIEQIRQMCSRVIWLEKGSIRMIGNSIEVCKAYLSEQTDAPPSSVSNNSYTENLYSPTQITKIDNQYFIVDCWHHRVIYNPNISDSISSWTILCDNVNTPHSIASDGELLILDDTGNNAVQVYKKKLQTYEFSQTIRNIGYQPNKIIYDKEKKLFYGISASSQQLFVLKNNNGEVEIDNVVRLDYLKNSYVRSISLIESKLYFVSGPGEILVANTEDMSFNLINKYSVPFELQGMNDLIKIDSYYYISVYQDGSGIIAPKLVRTKDLNLLGVNYEDLYNKLQMKGVPYNFSQIEDRVYITEIDSYSSIRSFKLVEDEIYDIQVHYNIGAADEASIHRRGYS